MFLKNTLLQLKNYNSIPFNSVKNVLCCRSTVPVNVLAKIKVRYWNSSRVRHIHCMEDIVHMDGEGALILGIYSLERGDDETIHHSGYPIIFTESGIKLNEKLGKRLLKYLDYAAPIPQLGEVRLLFGIDPYFYIIAVTGLGEECLGYNVQEQLDERKEAIRTGIGVAVRKLEQLHVTKIYVDGCGHAESAAEGASLASWAYQELKENRNAKINIPILKLFDSCDWQGWRVGLHKASAQNLARHLMETPSNLLTPSAFAQSAVEILSKHAINVEVRMQNWAKLRNMNAFLAVGMGSCEPPVFLELLYEGCEPNISPVVLIGKGLTFDTGGTNLKKKSEMEKERGDMAGAAILIATFRAISGLRLPINVRGLIPLCVSSLGSSSLKPGDTVSAMNGKTIYIEDTDHAEGLLMIADAMCYSAYLEPKFIIDIGTLTHGSLSAMSTSASLVFSNSESLYETLRIASLHTGDRIWRYPLWEYFKNYVQSTKIADVTNLVAPATGGEPGKAAAFLKEFVPDGIDWIHIDCYNVMTTTGTEFTYLRDGMAGRPTRTIIEFLAQLCCKYKIQETPFQECDVANKNEKKTENT